jgi:pheromone shutdown protein TraB
VAASASSPLRLLGKPQPAGAASSAPLATTALRSKQECDQAITHLVDTATNRELYLIGTAHISNASAILVRETIEKVSPDLVMVELDESRIRSSTRAGGPGGDMGLLLTRNGPLSPDPDTATGNPAAAAAPRSRSGGGGGGGGGPLAFVLGSAIKQLYGSMDKMGFSSGEEFAVAIREARRRGVPVLLGDQDVQVTLRRLSEALKKTDFARLAALDSGEALPSALAPAMTASPGSPVVVDMNDARQISAIVETMKQREAVRELTETLRREVPLVYDAMIGERDAYMASSLQLAFQSGGGGGSVPGETRLRVAVGVVGIAHAEGIERNLAAEGWKRAPCVV